MNTTLAKANRNYLLKLQESHGKLVEAIQGLLANTDGGTYRLSAKTKQVIRAHEALIFALSLME